MNNNTEFKNLDLAEHKSDELTSNLEKKLLPSRQLAEINPPHWYVLKTKPHYETTCSHLLRQNSITTYMPKLLSQSSRNHELKETPLFPGYLFFWLEDNSKFWPYMKWAFGVSYVLTGDSGPLNVSVELIQALAEQEGVQHRRLVEQLQHPFRVGEIVEIVDGPLQGLAAVFEGKISASGRCQVLIEILGRLSSVTVTEKALQRKAS